MLLVVVVVVVVVVAAVFVAVAVAAVVVAVVVLRISFFVLASVKLFVLVKGRRRRMDPWEIFYSWTCFA
jgi:hypothetical protein